MKAYLKDIRMALAAMMLLVSAAWGGRGKGSAKAVLWNSFLWGTGYLGFWAEKWILCNLLTEENIIADAFSAIAERAGSIRRICAVVLRVWKEPSENRKRIDGITSDC